MKSLQQIRNQLSALMPQLRARFEVETLELFGSYVRGEQNEKSDIDVLVTFGEPNDVDLFKFIELRLYLKDQLGLDVDLVERDVVKPRIKQRIYEEAVSV
jgi:uncharacterized protein